MLIAFFTLLKYYVKMIMIVKLLASQRYGIGLPELLSCSVICNENHAVLDARNPGLPDLSSVFHRALKLLSVESHALLSDGTTGRILTS
jgi:hypothetical protein